MQEGALVAVLARAGLGEELARHGAVVGVGRLVVLGLGVVHGLKALVVRRLGLVLGLEDGRRVEDRGAALNLLQVADELAVERVLNAVVGELPVEVVERGQDGPLGDDGDLLAVGLGRHRLLGRAALRQALPEHVGDFRQRAHDLHGQQLLVLVEGKARLVLVLDDVLDHVVEHGVEVNVQLRVVDHADKAAEPLALLVGVVIQRLLDNLLGKGAGHLDGRRLLNECDVARRLGRLVLDDDQRRELLEHALDHLVDVALNGRHVGMSK